MRICDIQIIYNGMACREVHKHIVAEVVWCIVTICRNIHGLIRRNIKSVTYNEGI